MFQRVRIRLTILTVAIFVVLYTVSSVAVYAIVRQAVLHSTNQALMASAQNVVTGKSTAVTALPVRMYFLRHTPERTATNLSANMEARLINAVETKHLTTRRVFTVSNAARTATYRVLFVPLHRLSSADSSGYALVAMDITPEYGVLGRLISVLWRVGIVGTLAAVIAGLWWASRALRPIRDAWQRQVDFVADASHELRTPLAVIQTNLGVLMEHTDETVGDNLEWVNNAHSETRRLSRLVDDLLTLARSDAQSKPLALERVSLSEISQRVVDLFEPVAAMRYLSLSSDIQPQVDLMGDRDRLHQLLVILVDNACKYTPAEGCVRVRLEEHKGLAVLTISDTGIGIANEDLPRVFDRFFRSKRVREHGAASGAGLGLAIAHWIVGAHRGKIVVSSEPGTGTSIAVTLPMPR